MLVESGIGLEDGKEFLGDEEDCGVDFLFDVDVVLADLVLEGFEAGLDVVRKRG